MKKIIVVAHNMRSTHNVGSLLRTADGLGIEKVYLTGYTPYPSSPQDARLPHIAQKLHTQIQKTALGAEETTAWQQTDDIITVVNTLKKDGYAVWALEQTENAVILHEFKAPEKIALVLGREVEGLEHEVLAICDGALEIPMFGQKESFNVSIAAGMALFHLRFN